MKKTSRGHTNKAEQLIKKSLRNPMLAGCGVRVEWDGDKWSWRVDFGGEWYVEKGTSSSAIHALIAVLQELLFHANYRQRLIGFRGELGSDDPRIGPRYRKWLLARKTAAPIAPK